MSSKDVQNLSILAQRLNALFQEERARGTSTRSVLLQLGMSETALAEWNRGKSKPTISAIIKLARYFNVSADYLLGLTDERKPLENREVAQPQTAVTEKGASEIAENFIREFKEQMKEKAFQDIAKLYKAIDLQKEIDRISMKAQILVVLVTYLKQNGINTESVVGY